MSEGKSDTLLVFALGALTGGIAALLLAPTSGPELRRKISDSGERLKEDAWGRASTALGNVESRARETVRQAQEAAAEVRATAGRQRSALKDAYEEGRRAYIRELQKAGDDVGDGEDEPEEQSA